MINQNVNIQTWKQKLQAIQKEREDYNLFKPKMTEYERDLFMRDLKESIDNNYSSIVGSIEGEWNKALADYKDAGKRLERSFQQEINSWDTSKLNAEIEYIRKSLPSISDKVNVLAGADRDPVKKLEGLFEEAMLSGDKHKIRAAAEVFKEEKQNAKGSTGRALVILASKAIEELEHIRETEAIQKAKQGLQEAWLEIVEREAIIRNAAVVLGERIDPIFGAGNFDKMLKRVQVDRSTGVINIYDPENEAVTGIIFEK